MTSDTQLKSVDIQMPKHREGLIERELPEELVLYDPETDRVFLLNRTSTAIWDLCDGKRSEQQIVGEIARDFGAPREDIVRDVLRTVVRLREDRLLA